MATPFESAQLNLRLFELRREPVLREAREWFLRECTPETFEELVTISQGARNASFRMVTGYWDMACSLVTFGAIEADMFRAAHTELMATVSKIYVFLPQLRQAGGISEFFAHAERVATTAPGGPERLAQLRAMFLQRKGRS